MEMRPARGRAQVILGRERFRCSRCGAKASAYFNIEDMNDPRAVARLERLKEAENMDYADDDDDEVSSTFQSCNSPILTLSHEFFLMNNFSFLSGVVVLKNNTQVPDDDK